jgi:integrase
MSVTIEWREDRQRWQVTYWLDSKRKRPMFRERPEAENFARKITLGLGAEDHNSITIEEAGQRYFYSDSQTKSRVSMANDRRYLNLHFHFMTYERGIERLASVRLEDVEAFRDWLPKQTEYDNKPMKWGPKTVNRCLVTIKRLYRRHIQWKNIADTPCIYLDFLDVDDTQVNERAAATGEQYLAALAQSEDWFKPVMQFIYLTGAPGSCVERLKWEDVDFDNRTYSFLRKKGCKAKWKRIHLKMTEEVFSLLILMRNKWQGADGPVFRDNKGRPLLADRICKAGSRAFKKAGFEGITNYCMRHGLASDMTAANIATEIIRQALGHANIATTQRYANKIGSKPILEAIATVRTQNSGGNLVAVAGSTASPLATDKKG